MRKFKLFLVVSVICTVSAYGQSPGGVNADLGLWVKADDGFTPSSWADKSGNNYHLTQSTTTLQPALTNAPDKFNFNPAVDFNNKAMGNNQIANRGVNNSLSLYSVASLETNSGANTLIGIGANGDNPHFGAYPNATFMMYTSLYGSADNPAMAMSKSYLMSGHWQHATAGTGRLELNGFTARTGGIKVPQQGILLSGMTLLIPLTSHGEDWFLRLLSIQAQNQETKTKESAAIWELSMALHFVQAELIPVHLIIFRQQVLIFGMAQRIVPITTIF